MWIWNEADTAGTVACHVDCHWLSSPTFKCPSGVWSGRDSQMLHKYSTETITVMPYSSLAPPLLLQLITALANNNKDIRGWTVPEIKSLLSLSWSVQRKENTNAISSFESKLTVKLYKKWSIKMSQNSWILLVRRGVNVLDLVHSTIYKFSNGKHLWNYDMSLIACCRLIGSFCYFLEDCKLWSINKQ